MNKRHFEILNEWASLSEYDENQTSFNLLNGSYKVHQGNKLIKNIIENYDETGLLAVLYARQLCKTLLKESTRPFSLYDLFTVQKISEKVKNAEKMWNSFNCLEVIDAEYEFFFMIKAFVSQFHKHVFLGEDDDEQNLELFLDALENVFESLEKCNVDLFLKSGRPIGKITKIKTSISIFDSLASCLIALENSEDGVYLCYISVDDSLDGYFGFYIVSNGNILSVNERVNEAYAGAHKYSRNGRRAEQKQYELFPYEIFSFTDTDYKGYYKKHIIDENQTALFNLSKESYFPILLGMILLIKKYSEKEIEEPVKYVDSLLKINVEKTLPNNQKKLIKVNKSCLITQQNNLAITFETAKVLSGEYAEDFNFKIHPEKKHDEVGFFANSNQIMVDLYGKDFTFDSNKLFERALALTDGKGDVSANQEFIGNVSRMQLQGYYKVRKCLAEYIRKEIQNEYEKVGGLTAVMQWYKSAMEKNLESLYTRIAAYCENGKSAIADGWHTSDDSILDIYYVEDTYPSGSLLKVSQIHNKQDGNKDVFKCDITDCTCNVWFTFAPKNWVQIEELIGEEVSKIVKGWQQSRSGDGNPILNSTDEVSYVKTPFEIRSDSYFNFKFSIGFSKRGLNKILKEYKDKE